MRWKKVLGGGLALILAASAGCKQTCWLSPCDVDRYLNNAEIPAHAECIPDLGVKPTPAALTAAPTTVNDPERPIRYLPLAEAVSIALQQGNVGDPGLTGQSNDDGLLPTSLSTAITGNIRVFAVDPAIAGLEIERALTRFDAVWTSSMNWNTTDRPVGTPLDTFQAGSAGINAIKTEAATFQTGIIKPLPTGGVAGITFRTDYQLTNLPSRVNPSYQPSLQFSFEQPLLQGFGVEINQIRTAHPGSILNPGAFNPQPTAEAILVTRLRFDQARADFERLVQQMVVNVEVAYWNLYGSYWNLYSQEAALRQAYTAYRILRTRFEAGKANVGEVAQARGQYELFRGNRLDALAQVLENERQLRRLMNLPVEDGVRLVPSDGPILAPYAPDWDSALNEALSLRPELVIARAELKARQFALIEAKNQLLPDLRFTGTYDINSIGTRLDGANNNNALRELASDHFNNWAVGLRLNVPLGFRLAHANVRRARLELERGILQLNEYEQVTNSILARYYRDLFRFHTQIGIQRSQREAYAEQLRARFEELLAGKTTVDVLLEAQRFWAQALAQEYNNVYLYNATLARFEWAKGTILRHDNILIHEGPLPECARERAIEHQRERDHSLVLCQRAGAGAYQPCNGPACGNGHPVRTKEDAAALPGMFENLTPLGADAERLPPPKEKNDKETKADDAGTEDKTLPASLGPVAPPNKTSDYPVRTLQPAATAAETEQESTRPLPPPPPAEAPLTEGQGALPPPPSLPPTSGDTGVPKQ
jgi:outer membrane protein TolC